MGNQGYKFIASRLLLGTAGLLPVSLAITPAGARAAETVVTDEIIVTATRRSETLQNVPMSIHVMTAENLERQAATTFADYATSVPNLTFGTSGEGTTNSRTIAIRGIGDRNTTGFYIDETPVPESLDPRVVDVSRIEVLRGPQGTLYGGRSMGGTVRLVTAQPDTGEMSGRVHAGIADTHGADRPSYQFDAMINLPLVEDKVAVRMVGIHQYDAGFMKREFGPEGSTTRVDNVARTRTNGASIAVLFKPAEDISLTPRVLYQETQMNGYPFTDLTLPGSGPVVLEPTSLIQRRQFDVPEASRDKWLLATFDIKLERDFGTFTSASSYFHRRSRDIDDQTDFIAAAFGVPPIPTTVEVRNNRDNFIQEVRFASSFGGPFEFVSGLYYAHNKGKYAYPPNIIPGLDAAFEAANGFPLGTDLVYVTENPVKQVEKAAYTEITYEIVPQLSAIAGLRAFHVRTTSSKTADGLANGGLSVVPEKSSSESGVTPKFSLQYKFADDNQIFATAAKGFRPGGVNALIPASFGCLDELAELGLTNESAGSFKSDSVWSYEAGVKSRTFDRKLTLNATAFRIDWNSIQQLVRLQCGFGFRGNAGKAKSEGIEIEAALRPAEGLSLEAAFGYTDAKFTETVLTTRRAKGDRVPEIAKYTASFAASYDFPLSNAIDGFVYGDYRYIGKSTSGNNANTDPDTGTLIPRIRPSYEIVNVRGGVRFGNYEIAAYVKNLTDERASLSDNVAAAVEAPGRARVYINTPRSIGIEARVNF